MSNYGFRDNKFTAKEIEAKNLDVSEVLEVKKENTSKAVSYIKMQSCAVGTVGMPDGYVYLYVGTAGALLISSTAPVGTTGALANAGGYLGTVA